MQRSSKKKKKESKKPPTLQKVEPSGPGGAVASSSGATRKRGTSSRMCRFFCWPIIAIVAATVAHLLVKGNVFTTLTPVPLPCTRVPLPYTGGSEDLVIDHETGLAYLSVCNVRSQRMDMEEPTEGGILFYNLSDPSPTPKQPKMVNLPPNVDLNCPHGVGLLRNKGTEPRYLFVIVHSKTEEGESHPIYRFKHMPNTNQLIFEEKFSNPELLISPNDVVPMALRSFYVTNDHSTQNKLAMLVQDLFSELWKGGSLVFHWASIYNKKTWTTLLKGNVIWNVVDDGLQMGNGIEVSPDHSLLYVAESHTKAIRIYDIKKKETPKLLSTVVTDTLVDNLNMDETGHLWAGGQPKPFSSLFHFFNPKTNRSPAQVLRFTPIKDEKGVPSLKVEEVYLNLGEEISASSVGAAWRDRLLIGGVIDNWILDCKLPPNFQSTQA